MVEKLNKLGIAITLDDIKKFAGEDVVGRLHFALALLDKGAVKTKQEAFDRYLGNGKPGYVGREKLTGPTAVTMIAENGGIPVLAHPILLNISDSALRLMIREMKEAGLKGIEVFHSEQPAAATKKYMDLAAEFDLIITGGSDFHGESMPDIKLGRGFGNLDIPYSILEKLKECRR
jgi:predicted metal-dependent phosphoesterase TrpH